VVSRVQQWKAKLYGNQPKQFAYLFTFMRKDKAQYSVNFSSFQYFIQLNDLTSFPFKTLHEPIFNQFSNLSGVCTSI
jgi:hypothetical protein